ncbi:hypothetical protein BC829DRAFT_420598 [Chytridium lagenaria]|nr:hypothetical protein BC829DRAFT_420598 [Chytridium lagenaria]
MVRPWYCHNLWLDEVDLPKLMIQDYWTKIATTNRPEYRDRLAFLKKQGIPRRQVPAPRYTVAEDNDGFESDKDSEVPLTKKTARAGKSIKKNLRDVATKDNEKPTTLAKPLIPLPLYIDEDELPLAIESLRDPKTNTTDGFYWKEVT